MGLKTVCRIRTFCLLPLLFATGCGTILDLSNAADADVTSGSGGPHLYGGVRFDANLLSHPGCKVGQLAPLVVLDFPLSVALDTALLPVTLALDLAGARRPSRRPTPHPGDDGDR